MSSIFLQLLLGFIFADIITGGFHWFEDTYLDYCIDIPLINKIAKENEMHHYFPRSILAYSYFVNIDLSCIFAVIIISIICILNNKILNYPYFIICFGFFCIISNLLHRFSHMRDCENNSIITSLQKLGILCSHSHHSQHHNSVGEKYCIIMEYSNYVLDSLYFWRILEIIILLLTGIKPHRKKSYDSYPIQNHMHENAKLICPDTPTKEDIKELERKLKIYKNCKN